MAVPQLVAARLRTLSSRIPNFSSVASCRRAPPRAFTSSPYFRQSPRCIFGRGVFPKHGQGSGITARTLEQSYLPRVQFQCWRLIFGAGPSKEDDDDPTKASFRVRLQETPTPALYVGFAGLLPFAVPALLCLGSLSYSPLLAATQVAYGATVLSFLGGVRWGYSLDDGVSPASWRNLWYSATPPLVAWLGLLLTPESGTLALMAGLAVAWRWDVKTKATPSWFRALRVCLSVGAIVSLGLTFTMGLLFPPPDTSTTYNWVKLMKIVKIILED